MDIRVITINIIYSKHALQKIDELGIERKEVESTLQKGMKWERDGKWHAAMCGIEVVFQKEEETAIIITVYYEGSKK